MEPASRPGDPMRYHGRVSRKRARRARVSKRKRVRQGPAARAPSVPARQTEQAASASRLERGAVTYAFWALALTAAIKLLTLFPLWVCWLLGVNLTAIIAHGLDKAAAARRHRRVPEIVLQLLAATGGSPGAVLARTLLRTPAQSPSSSRALRLIVGAQLLILGALFAWWQFERP